MPFSKLTTVTIVLGLVGAIVYFTQFASYSPKASVDLQYSRDEIVDIATEYLSDLGYAVEGMYSDASFRFDSQTAMYLGIRLGLKDANDILRSDTLMTHNWHVYFFNRSQPPSQMHDRYNVRVTPTGKILGFEHIFSDTMALPSLAPAEAFELARTFLQGEGLDLDDYTLENSAVNELAARKDYAFTWTSQDSVYGLQGKIWLDIHGDRVGRYRYRLLEPESYDHAVSRTNTIVTFIVTASSIATFVLLIFIISLFLKKYHDGEVGVRTAIYVFAILFGITVLDYCLRFTSIGYGVGLGDVNRFNVRIIVFIITVFIVQAFLAAMAFAGWSVGESSARRGWSEKLKALDGLQFGKPFTVNLANAVVRGYAFGFVILGVILLAVMLASRTGSVGIFVLDTNGIPESALPSLNVIALALRIALLNEIVFRFFFNAWLREKTGRVWHGVLISSLLWTLIAFNLWDFPLGYLHFKWQFPVFFVFGLVLGVIVVRYDLMTAIVTSFVVLALGYATPMLVASADFYQIHEILFYLFLAIPLVVAAIGYIKRQQFQFTLELTPAHIKRISERERMARELEIARTVQMSLLPKGNPLVEGYDIAGICLPALEVGGDYYDFIQLEQGKIGIAIGDVSGKGVPAAIYMTLTKGILQSHASENSSPAEVLIKLNRQMYLNIERNSFVSMFYAVLDMRKHKIRFARAGHNPAILAQRSTNVSTLLQPRGIALGLEQGPRFQTTLEEHEMPLQSGDVLTFYTDGFTEASNAQGEEFGEQRLENIISSSKLDSANGIIQGVVRSVKTFVGNTPQHDDMTMVVIKVL